MTLEKLCEEVLSLDEKATKGPWSFKTEPIDHDDLNRLADTDGECTAGNVSVLKSWDYEGYSSGISRRPEDAALIESYRTSAPKLARALLMLLEGYKESGTKYDEPNSRLEYLEYIFEEVEKLLEEK